MQVFYIELKGAFEIRLYRFDRLSFSRFSNSLKPVEHIERMKKLV
jgi:hypothetical protein